MPMMMGPPLMGPPLHMGMGGMGMRPSSTGVPGVPPPPPKQQAAAEAAEDSRAEAAEDSTDEEALREALGVATAKFVPGKARPPGARDREEFLEPSLESATLVREL